MCPIQFELIFNLVVGQLSRWININPLALWSYEVPLIRKL